MKVEFDFLGKDSIRFNKTVDLPQKVVDNIKEFINEGNQEIFDGITSADVSEFLGRALTGLTAKVFRTYIATATVQNYLDKLPSKLESQPDFLKVFYAKKANLKAAQELNHRRTLPKGFDEKLAVKQAKIKEFEDARDKSEKHLKLKAEVTLLEEGKDYALGTSLNNYIDPRVYIEYCKRVGLDLSKIYSKTLLKKISWALEEEDNDETP